MSGERDELPEDRPNLFFGESCSAGERCCPADHDGLLCGVESWKPGGPFGLPHHVGDMHSIGDKADQCTIDTLDLRA